MSSLKDLAEEYSALWDAAKIADDSRYQKDCYGDLPRNRGPHVLGRSEKGLAADKLAEALAKKKEVAALRLKGAVISELGVDPWKIRSLFI